MSAQTTQDDGADPRRGPASLGRTLAYVALTLAGLALLWQLSDAVLLVFGAILVAVVLRSLAHPLHARLQLPPRLAVIVALLALVLALVLTGWAAGDRLAEQAGMLRERLPEALKALENWADQRGAGDAIRTAWREASATDVPWGQVARAASGTLGALGSALLILVVGVYLAIEPELYIRGVQRLLPIRRRPRVDAALRASGEALAKWLLGQGISMLFVGATTAIGLALLGVPLALFLGVIAGLLGFIPFFGAIGAGALAVLLAFTQSPTQALYVAILAVAIQQVEGNLLMPYVQRRTVSLPPALAILATVIFGLLFGIPGVIVATPLMVVVMVLTQELYVRGVLEADVPEPAAAGQAAAQTPARR